MKFTLFHDRRHRKKGCSILISMLLMCLLCCTAQAQDPNPVADKYSVMGSDGETVTYYNAHSASLNSSGEFLKGLLGNKTDLFKDNTYTDGRSISDLWLQAGVRILQKENGPGTGTYKDYIIDKDKGNYLYALAGGQNNTASPPISAHKVALTHYNSLKEAEEGVLQNLHQTVGSDSPQKKFQNNTGGGDAFVTVLYVGEQTDFKEEAIAVYFSDFQAVALLPDARTSNNYVPTFSQTSGSGDGKIIASNVMNLSAGTVTASQNITQSNTATVTSTVSGSSSYSLSQGIKLGTEVSLFDVAKMSTEISLTQTQAFTKGWSKGESVSETSTTNHAVSVTLPPYTNVMLKQLNSTSSQETRYNCPVGIKYKAHILFYTSRSVLTKQFTFGSASNDARADLLKRAVWNRNLENSDPDGIDWVATFGEDPVIGLITHSVPMSSAGGKFESVLTTVTDEVDGILPVYPLSMVTLKAPAVSFISDKPISYGSFNYLTAQMKVGDYSFTNYLDLQGYNIMGAEYYGFSKFRGHWIVTDKLSGAANKEMDPASAPVVLETDSVTGNIRYTAVRPGSCYLKYIIDENVYNTADNPNEFTKNSDLRKAAALQIVVSEKLTYVPRVEATNEKNGNIAYYKSAATGRIYEDEDGKKELTQESVVIPAKGQNDDSTDASSSTQNQFLLLQAKKITNKYFTLKWNRVQGASEYEIYGGECGDAYEKLDTLHYANSTKKIRKIKGSALKANRYYRFFVVAYKAVGDKRVEIGRSVPIHLLTKGSSNKNIKKVVLKTPKAISLNIGQTTKVRAVQKKESNGKVRIHSKVRYVSTNPAIASVGQTNGVVTASGHGTCLIYCIGQNGKYKTVTVTV